MTASKYRVGLRYGVITGLIYMVLLFLRYHFFAGSPVTFFLFSTASYIIVLLMYLATGIARKKELGGYGDLKEIFQSIFIVILITELVYVLFNFIYFKFADPAFWEKFNAVSLEYDRRQHMTAEEIDQSMKGFRDAAKNMQPATLVKNYGVSVVIDAVFGIILAAVIRKNRPVSGESPENTKL
jgi:uncharacterized membrane protein (UPF0182 family)